VGSRQLEGSPSALTRVLAADGFLVAEVCHPGAAVAAAPAGRVEVDLEAVHPRADPVVVVELPRETGREGDL